MSVSRENGRLVRVRGEVLDERVPVAYPVPREERGGVPSVPVQRVEIVVRDERPRSMPAGYEYVPPRRGVPPFVMFLLYWMAVVCAIVATVYILSIAGAIDVAPWVQDARELEQQQRTGGGSR